MGKRVTKVVLFRTGNPKNSRRTSGRFEASVGLVTTVMFSSLTNWVEAVSRTLLAMLAER